MQNFKKYLTEKNRLMQKYEKGEIDIMSYNVPTRGGSDYEYDNTNEILKTLHISVYPIKIIDKFKKEVSKIPYGKSSNEWNLIHSFLLKFKDSDIKQMLNFASGKNNFVLGFNILSDKNMDKMNEYYSNPKNLKILENKLKDLKKYQKYLNDFQEKQIQKAEVKLGISWRDIVQGFKHIDYFKGKGGRNLPKSIWPFLHAITVKINKKLPKTVYRGIFLDGKKVDKNQDYSIGNKIKLNNKKATSWSTSIGEAAMFTVAQDNVEDKENGYGLIIKYDIQNPEDDIIADFRIFKSKEYYNQQEILLSPKVKYGEIVYSKKGGSFENDSKKHINFKYGDSMGTLTFLDYIVNIGKVKKSNLSLYDKIEMKDIFNMTLEEVGKKYPEFDAVITSSVGCLLKVNAILGLALKGYIDYIENCSYKSVDLVDSEIDLTNDIVKELQSFGLKIKSQLFPEVKIKMTIHYEIKIKGYASEVKAKIKDINIEPKPGENFEHNVKVAPEVKEKILKSKNIKKYIPGSTHWDNLKII